MNSRRIIKKIVEMAVFLLKKDGKYKLELTGKGFFNVKVMGKEEEENKSKVFTFSSGCLSIRYDFYTWRQGFFEYFFSMDTNSIEIYDGDMLVFHADISSLGILDNYTYIPGEWEQMLKNLYKQSKRLP